MSVSRNHQCTSEFNEIYQSESWQIKFKDFHNREKKQAHLKLIEKFKKKTSLTQKKNVKKIYNIRSNYPKEFKKV